MSCYPKKCVVVPIDFSASSDEAIRTALEIAEQPSDVHVVHVALVPNPMPYAGEVFDVVDLKRWLELANTHLTKYLKSHPEFAGVDAQVIEGHARSRIVSFATELHADLIVMPSHGYHGVKRFFLGSVTESVLRHAPCEVLVLRRGD